MHIALFVVLAFVAGILVHRHLQQRRARAAAQSVAAPLSEYEAYVSVDTFNALVIETSQQTPVLVDFYASWCPPCHYLGPVLAEMAKDYAGRFLLAKVDVDEQQPLARQYNIRSMPTVILFREGRAVAQFVGARQPHAIRFFLAQQGVLAPDAHAAGTTS